MQVRLAALLCLALAAACGPPGGGKPRPVREPAGANVERAFYDVIGGSVGELLASLKEQAPAATQTDSNFARTTWTVTWDGQWAPAAGDSVCAVTTSRVQLESRMALPRWRPSPGAPGDLSTDWAKFVRNLAGHENGHLVTAVSAAHRVEASLGALRGPCDAMRDRAQAAMDSIVASFRLVDEDYDRRTGYGALQGAVWPPRTSPRLRVPGPEEAVHAPPNPAPAIGRP
jgi:predicted secreted Zn-dependent protease